MIVKYLIAFLLFTSPCLAGMGVSVFPCPGPGVLVSGGGTCSETPSIIQDTHSTGTTLGSTTALYYAGIVNTSATPLTLCAFEPYIRENGSLAGQTLYLEKWTVDPTTHALLVKQQDVTSFDATLPSSTISYYKISNINVTLSQNEGLVLTFNSTPGATNNLTVAYISPSAIANQEYMTWDSSLGATYVFGQDIRAKFY